MKTNPRILLFLFALISPGDAAPLITGLVRLDIDQTGGPGETVFPTFGGIPYQDYSFSYSSWPSYLNGAEMVRMVNGDAMDRDYKLQLTLSQPATVYLIVDDRTSTAALPWVAGQGFQDTGDTVMVWDFPYSIYAATAPAGAFTVRENSPSLNMYTVAVVPEPGSVLMALCGGTGLMLRRRR